MAKTFRKRLIEKLDKQAKRECLARDKVCFYCQKARAVQAHHVSEGKGTNTGIRFDLRNLIGLCSWCHGRIHSSSFSKSSFIMYFKSMYPARWRYINSPVRFHIFTQEELEAMLK